ncbi:MAG: ketopantoate reductase family protein [Chloroflexi bacterium]|nr:ketopantoate reductase family protein [Chloroflexota bacterium]
MRIAVIGAGAIGSAIGALLGRAGHEVTLVGRPAHIAAIRSAGLQVDCSLGSFTIALDATERLEHRPDIALVTTKTQDLQHAVLTNRAALAGVPVVVIHNGVRGWELATEVLPPCNVWSGVTLMIATYLVAGRVSLASHGWLLIGRASGPVDARTTALADVLKTALPTSISNDILAAQWTKLIVNLNNAVGAMTGLDTADVVADCLLSRLSIGLMREGVQVAQRAGIRLASLPDLSATQLQLTLRLPLWLAVRLAARKARSVRVDGQVWGSTLQSLKRGQPTEIDYLNGEVVRLGRQVGIPTPLNAQVVALVHEVERTGRYFRHGELRTLLPATGSGQLAFGWTPETVDRGDQERKPSQRYSS